MLKPSPRTPAVLRWIAVVPVVLLVTMVGLMAVAIASLPVVNLATHAAIALVLALAVYLGSRVAPSRRRRAIALAAAPLVLLTLVILLSGDVSVGAAGLLAVAGIGFGALLAWRRARLDPRLMVLAAEGKSLRYKGTAPYQDLEIDRKTFFGRDRESRSLRSLVLAERLVVLFAKSGMGKTSLINAGLAKPLREMDYFPMVVRLADRERGPLGSLVDGIRAAAQTAGVDVVGADESSAWSLFKTAEFWSQRDDLLRPVLIIDQFEELFTLHAPEPRREFVGQLAELVRGRTVAGPGAAAEVGSDPALGSGPPELKIVLSLREDFLADLEELAEDIPGILHHRFRLGPLTSDGARQAIVGPAALADEAFDSLPFSYRDEAVQRIITFLTRRRHGAAAVTTDEVEPAQLQLVCQYLEELVRARQASGGADAGAEISAADLADEAQLQRVLEGFYDRTVAAIRSPWERRRVQRLCERRLISGGGRRLTEDEEEIYKRHKVSKERLQALVNARLLRPEPRLGGVFYELSHDTLVAPIQQSRKKRVLRNQVELGAALALILTGVVGGWALTREKTAYQRAVASLPHPNVAFERLVREKLDRIDEGATRWVRDRKRFGPVAALVQDAIRLTENRELRARAEELGETLREKFQEVHDVAASPPPTEDEKLNRRVRIEGGTFEMGRRETVGSSDEFPSSRVTLSPFAIQEHEVTNEEYARFDREHEFERGEERHPAAYVDWYDAMAYAAWLGGSLPTEAQWEFAARGAEGREFPWGPQDPDCDRAQFRGCDPGGTVSVCSKALGNTPETRLCDLAGNVWEWCRDWYGRYTPEDQLDPLGPSEGSKRVLRGGSFGFGPRYLRGADRFNFPPGSEGGYFGFRVVWSAAGGLD